MVTASDVIELLSGLGLSPVIRASRNIEDCCFDHIERPADARALACSWLRPDRAVRDWRGSVLIGSASDLDVEVLVRSDPWAIITVEQPRLAMLRILQTWFANIAPRIIVHPTARIHPSVVIGASDAGYVWTGERYEKFPHVGGVVIGPHVEIDPLTVVSRAAIGDTIIGEGTKIGPQVTVGHGAHIGKHCVLVSQVCITGSAELGDRVMCWAQSMVGGVRVGDRAVIGAGAVVLADVPPGETWAGVPAREIRSARGS